MTEIHNSMEIRHLMALDDKLVNVGEWDWEAFEAHKLGMEVMSQADVMNFLKKPNRLLQAQEEAKRDAACHARRLCVVIDGFMPEAECDLLVSQLNPLLRPTASPSLRNFVLNYSHDAHEGDANARESTVELLSTISQRLWSRLNQLGEAIEDESGRALLRELRTAPKWSCRDYHVRHSSRGGSSGEMEMLLRAMSDHVRVMRYSVPEGKQTPTGDSLQDDGDFATDPRNSHHDGRNRRPTGDSFVTALLYLNSEGESPDGPGGEPLEGGHTLFLDDNGRPVARFAPRKGSLLLFDHHLYHRGERVWRGAKFCLRTDLLYMPCDARTGEPMVELMR